MHHITNIEDDDNYIIKDDSIHKAIKGVDMLEEIYRGDKVYTWMYELNQIRSELAWFLRYNDETYVLRNRYQHYHKEAHANRMSLKELLHFISMGNANTQQAFIDVSNTCSRIVFYTAIMALYTNLELVEKEIKNDIR